MHLVSQLEVKNFKSIVNGSFSFSAYTPLVGYNNAGKSNLLDAVLWIVNKSSLPERDFYDPAEPIIIEGVISGITEDVLQTLGDTHATKIRPYLREESLKVRRVQPAPGVPAKDIRLEVEKIDAGVSSWDINPAGIDNAIKNLLPEPILIGAMENATDDVAKFGAGTTIGKLLKAIIEPINQQHNQSIQTALQTVSQTLSADGTNRDPALVALDGKIDSSLKEIFPGITAKAHIPIPQFNDFLKSATIKLSEEGSAGATWKDASSLGHGAQRSVQIALIKCLSLINKEAKGHEARTTILLIDEPELYLHPQAIETVKSALKQLSINGYQVIFATHSANMINRTDAPNASLIRKDVLNGTHSLPRLSSVVRQKIADADSQAEVIFELTNSNQILFSEKIILAEGKTEKRLLPDLYLGIRNVSFGQNKLGLVSLGGSGNIIKTLEILHAMGLPTRAIVDLDFCFKVAAGTSVLAADHPDVVAFKQGVVQSAAAHGFSVGNDGLPEKCNDFTAAEGFALTAADGQVTASIENVHNHLKIQGIWIWRSGAIEAPLQLEGKSPHHHSGFLNSFNSTLNKTTLPYYPELISLFDWLES